MVFNSLHFVVFFAVVYAVYRLLRHRAQNLWLLAASYYFYAAWDWRFTGLLAASTLVSYWAGAALGRPAVRASRAASLRVLWAALGFLLAVLGFFKYAGFFVDLGGARAVDHRLDVGDPVLAIVLPLGISFYTFMAMATSIDVYRGDMAPVAQPRRLRAVRRLLPAPGGRPDPARAGADAAVRGAAHDPRSRSVDRRLADRHRACSRRSSSPTTCRRWSTRCSRRPSRRPAATC